MAESKLRFTQDNGERYPDLAHLTMGDIYTERNDRGDPSLPVLTVSIHSGVSDGELDEDELGKRVKRSSDLSQYKKAVSGDLVFNMMRAWQGAVGCVKTTGLTSPAYIVAKPNEKIYPPYMDYYVQTKNIIDKFNRLSYGALDFRKRLYWDSFITADINIPVLEEQKKIADFLAIVDEAITASDAEVINLEIQKKAVMKKIFSQEVRFARPDGSFFPDWEVKTIENCSEMIKDGTHGTHKNTTTDGHLLLSAKDIYDGFVHKPHDARHISDDDYRTIYKTYSLSIGDVLVTIVGTLGRTAVVTEDCLDVAFQRSVGIIRPLKYISSIYLQYVMNNPSFQKELERKKSKGAQAGIYLGTLAKIQIPIPCLEEQRMIADFLSDFDEAITAAKKELGLWKQLKKTLLQQLFV